FAAHQALAQRGVRGNASHLLPVDEVEVLVALRLRQAMLLDELPDLRPFRLLLGALLLLPAELAVPRRLGGHGCCGALVALLCGLLVARLEALLLLGLLRLFLRAEPGCQQLLAQGHAHGLDLGTSPDVFMGMRGTMTSARGVGQPGAGN